MLLKSIEEWKKDEMTRHTAELEAVRNTFMKELKEVEKKHQNSEIALKELQDKYAQVSQLYLEKSHFQHSSSLEREQEVQALKEQFESQLNFVESDLQKYLKKQEKEWQKKMEKQLYERNLEIEKLNSALQESIEQIRKEQEKKASNEKYYVKQIQKLTDISKEQEKKLKEISDMQ
ncbi:trichohyalin-like, partial [Centruroides sculpturatus]